MQTGDVFDGRYLILKILGRGGMGTVYLARNIKTDTYWTIKEILKNEEEEAELPTEPRLLKKLEHPALPRLFDMLEQDGKLYMVFDYAEGISLDKKLEEEGKISEDTVIGWAVQLCEALDYLHNQKPNPVIYRDMKPSNIILAPDGTLKLIDFGIAREFRPQSDGDTVYIGTRGFAAPEQYGAGQTSAVSDIYSLGVTMHQLLTGRSPSAPPFGLKPVRYYDSTLSPAIEAIVLKCTRENVNERYRNAAELLEALKTLRRKRGGAGCSDRGDGGLRGEVGSGGQGNNIGGGGKHGAPEKCGNQVSIPETGGSRGATSENCESRNRTSGNCRNRGATPENYGSRGSTSGNCDSPCEGSVGLSGGNRNAKAAGSAGAGRTGTNRGGRNTSERNEKSTSKHAGTGAAVSSEVNGNMPEYPASFRKMVITIWDNAEFGCELAYMAARHTGGEVMLADLDLLAPKADLFLNIRKYPGRTVHEGIFGYTGLDIVMNAMGKGPLSQELLREAAAGRKDLENLHILTGNYRLENYEYFGEDSVSGLIEKCYRTYDITILLVNRWIYDAFTLSALLKSDVNLVAVKGNIDELREFNTYIAFLKDKQKLPPENTRFVLFEYDKGACLSISEVNEAAGGNLIGRISASRRRAVYRNLKGAYASRMEKEIEKEYVQLLEKLGLLRAPGMIQKFGILALRCFGSGRRGRSVLLK